MTNPVDFDSLMALAYDLSQSGREAEAERAFEAAARSDPANAVPWYELGLLCKYQSRWPESLEFNSKAAYLDASDEAAWWNMGIAATALSNWAAAREAWARCGISLPPGDGPPDTDFGLVPIRLDPGNAGEVVWARRIDPARAVIENVPLPGTIFRWRDVVLHDGAPEGYRFLDGREVPVFNALQRLQPSEYSTFIVELASSDEVSVDQLTCLADELGRHAENWGTTTNILCRECSLGRPHSHQTDKSPANPHCGVAARDEDHAGRIIDAWLSRAIGADIVRWYAAADSV